MNNRYFSNKIIGCIAFEIKCKSCSTETCLVVEAYRIGLDQWGMYQESVSLYTPCINCDNVIFFTVSNYGITYE